MSKFTFYDPKIRPEIRGGNKWYIVKAWTGVFPRTYTEIEMFETREEAEKFVEANQ